MAESTEKAAAVSKKPSVRVITDKRREQNRRSQRAYRERVKKRFEELEEEVASNNVHKVSEEVNKPAQRVTETHQSIRGTSSLADQPAFANTFVFSASGDIFEAAGDIAIPTGTHTSAPSFHLSIRPHNVDIQDESDLVATNISPAFPFSATDEFGMMPSPDPGSIDMRYMWPMPANASNKPYVPPPISRFRRGLAQSPNSLTPGSWRSSKTHTPSSLADPYLNHIQLAGESFLTATLALALSIGVSRSTYVNDHPSLFYHAPEPTFYHIPRALRPTPAQLTLPHPVYLDCIVFPTFRSRAIILSARGELDHMALFMDLFHGGLVCWGNVNTGSGYGKDMRDGVAWSNRSWEATPWFLKRWSFLIGKEEDDRNYNLNWGKGSTPLSVSSEDDIQDEDGIWEQSRWWRALRGADENEELEE